MEHSSEPNPDVSVIDADNVITDPAMDDEVTQPHIPEVQEVQTNKVLEHAKVILEKMRTTMRDAYDESLKKGAVSFDMLRQEIKHVIPHVGIDLASAVAVYALCRLAGMPQDVSTGLTYTLTTLVGVANAYRDNKA